MNEKVTEFLHSIGYDFDDEGNLLADEIDSIEFINIVMAIEEEFSVEIPDTFLLIDHFSSVDTILNTIEFAKGNQND